MWNVSFQTGPQNAYLQASSRGKIDPTLSSSLDVSSAFIILNRKQHCVHSNGKHLSGITRAFPCFDLPNYRSYFSSVSIWTENKVLFSKHTIRCFSIAPWPENEIRLLADKLGIEWLGFFLSFFFFLIHEMVLLLL